MLHHLGPHQRALDLRRPHQEFSVTGDQPDVAQVHRGAHVQIQALHVQHVSGLDPVLLAPGLYNGEGGHELPSA